MHVLGIDGGGSHTRALICDTDGHILGRGQSGSSNPYSQSLENCRAHLEEAIQQAFSTTAHAPLAAAHLGIAGAGKESGRTVIETIASELFDPSQTKVTISHDLEIALEGGLPGEPGVALVAGTGSACYGRAPNGETAMCGGWGDLVDDAGSGSWIGLKALQACVRQADGRLTESELKPRIMEAIGIASMDVFTQRIHLEGFSRSERAELAELVFDLAELGDPHAGAIMKRAAVELSRLTTACALKLSIAAPQVVLLGGLMKDAPFRSLTTAQMNASLPEATVHEPKLPALCGAVLKALQSCGLGASEYPIDQLQQATY